MKYLNFCLKGGKTPFIEEVKNINPCGLPDLSAAPI
jgi:hypothetical protein